MSGSEEKSAQELFCPRDEPRNTKERLLHIALDLFYTHGFHAIGIDRVIAEAGVSKTTFYNHYESKDDLILAAIKKQDEWETEAFGRAVQELGGYDPQAMLLAMFDVLHRWFSHADYQGCLFLNASSEFPSAVDPVHRAAAKHYLAAEESMAKMARAAGVDDPSALAREWVILLMGATSYRQMTGDDDSPVAARAIAERILAARTQG